MKKILPLLGALALGIIIMTSCEKGPDEPTPPVEPTEYSVTVTAGEGGSAEALVDGDVVDKAIEGNVIAIVATPDEDHIFSHWTVSGGDVKLSDATDAETTFTMPAANVEIAAEFTAKPEEVADVFTKITDPAFKAYCEQFDTDGDGILSLAEAGAVTSIDVSGQDIASLAGIEYFTALTELICFGNLLTELDVSALASLTTLNCWGNRLTELDVSRNKALEILECDENWLTVLDVSGLVSLSKLYCSWNELTELDVSGCTALTLLICSFNWLTELDLSGNGELDYLLCAENLLTEFDLSQNTALTTVDFTYNRLEALDVSNNAALVKLYCGGNMLTSLDVSHNKDLTHLHCWENRLDVLNLQHNPALTDMECDCNLLTSLDISHNTALTSLLCYDNRIAELDASGMNSPAEYILYCGNQTLDGITAQILTLTLTEEQKPRWHDTLASAFVEGYPSVNKNVILAD